MKTVSLLQPEASQARTSCGELYAKKRKTGEGVDSLNMIRARMERVQFQRARAGRKERPKSLFYLE